jgi:hypothetical protein
MIKKSSKSRRYGRKQGGSKKRSTRRSRSSSGLSSRLYHPVGEIVDATGETIGEVSSTVGNVSKRTIKGASEIGRVWTRHINSALSLKGR